MSLFPQRQEAVKVLYHAAGQLLDDVTVDTCFGGRQLCRDRANECIELAEQIAGMEPVKIHVSAAGVEQVENVPFALGYIVKDYEPDSA